jgi:quercetin 2,3-dioxygenase
VADPTYLDVTLAAGDSFTQPVPRGHTAFAYIFEGEGVFGADEEIIAQSRLIIFSDGDHVQVRTKGQPARFLLVSGKPLYEPIARYGPFVMNTREEIEQALRDLRNGTFVR